MLLNEYIRPSTGEPFDGDIPDQITVFYSKEIGGSLALIEETGSSSNRKLLDRWMLSEGYVRVSDDTKKSLSIKTVINN